MSLNRFRRNQPITVNLPDEPSQTPQQPQPRRPRKIWFWVAGFVIVCLVLSAVGVPLFTKRDQNGDPVITLPQLATPVSPAQPQQGNQPANPNQQPADPQIELDTITVCSPSFVPYFNTQQMLANYDRSKYILKFIAMEFPDENGDLIEFTSPDGTMTFTGSEDDQVTATEIGACDILLNTNDVLAKNPQIGSWIADIGISDGADYFVMRKVGIAGCPGKPIAKVNDLEGGCIIAVSPNAVGHYQALSIMFAGSMNPSGVTFLTGKYDENGEWHNFSVEEAVAAFNAGEADAVPGWIPYINDAAYTPEGILRDDIQIAANSTWLRNIWDIIIVSPKANVEKEDAVFWFLVDWFRASKVQQENLAAAAEEIAAWQYEAPNGMTYATNDWTYVYPGTALENMHETLDFYGQASMDGNLLLVDQDEQAQVVIDRTLDYREIWTYGGVPLSPLADPSSLVEPKYLLRLKEFALANPDLRPKSGSTFPNTSYVPFQGVPRDPQDAAQLVDLPTVLELGCASQLNFGMGEDFLQPGTSDYNNFVECSANLATFIPKTKNATILVTGSAAFWCGYTEDYVRKFADQRADYVIYALVQGAGIPSPYVVKAPAHVGTFSCNDAVNQADRWVKIEVKLDTSFR